MSDVTAAPRVAESIIAQVPPEVAYAAVSDVARMGEWSPECRGAWIIGRGALPRKGMRFLGRNRASWLPWVTLCTVVEATPGRVFAFDVSLFGLPLSRWTYRFVQLPHGCEVTEEWQDRRSGLPGRLITAVAPLLTGVVRRTARNRTTMRSTLTALRDALESGR
ncbi:SRPBCC family protein [Streptomyces sp. NBC_00829]|uniref:SRPBCC family protein n=1 Tax=Streptomyces sp. NBC_00829 TaxID=2903679 RepID=UPI00386E9BC6|nr:SRPBCC family protein [Streptomyces sp. NBC_00829]